MRRRALAVAIALAAGCSPPPAKPAGPKAQPGVATDATAQLKAKLTTIARINSAGLEATRLQQRQGTGGREFGAALVGNNGGGVVSNNGGGVLANNGAGVVGNNGALFHLLAGEPQILPGAQPGETEAVALKFLDGSGITFFGRPGGGRREVHSLPGAVPYRERTAQTPVAAGEGTTVAGNQTFLVGAASFTTATQDTFDKAHHLQRLEYHDGRLLDPAAHREVRIPSFVADVPSASGSFTYEFPALGLKETGTLTQVALDANGGVAVSLAEPLLIYPGKSEVRDAAGALLYQKRTTVDGGRRKLTYQLDDRRRLELDTTALALPYHGSLFVDGQPPAPVVETASPDGQVAFEVTLAGGALKASADEAPPAPTAAPGGKPATEFTVGTLDGTSVALPAPTGMAGKPGLLYVSCPGAHQIVRMTYQMAGDDLKYGLEPLNVSELAKPHGLALATDGTLYVGDAGSNAVIAIAADGSSRSLLVPPNDAGFQDGSAATARLHTPGGLAWDPAGKLYVADNLNHAIRVVDLVDPLHPVTTLAGTGQPGALDGPGAQASFNLPYGLALDGAGGLLVADMGSGRIRRVALADPTHPVTTLAGGATHVADGPAAQAGFGVPFALAPGPNGACWITDRGANLVRRLAADGSVATIAGDGTKGLAGGFMTEARFATPCGLVLDPEHGLAFVADQGNNVLRIIIANQPTLP